mgnify:CR=1 FL=1
MRRNPKFEEIFHITKSVATREPIDWTKIQFTELIRNSELA